MMATVSSKKKSTPVASNGIDWDGIVKIASVQEQGAIGVAAAHAAITPPPVTSTSAVAGFNFLAALALGAAGYFGAKALSFPPLAGAAVGGVVGGVFLGS